MSAEVTPITADEARDALTAAAFTVTDPDSTDHGRTIVHCFSGLLGADWDLEGVLALLLDARDIAWAPSVVGHELYIQDAEGRIRAFNVRRPAADAKEGRS